MSPIVLEHILPQTLPSFNLCAIRDLPARCQILLGYHTITAPCQLYLESSTLTSIHPGVSAGIPFGVHLEEDLSIQGDY